MKNIPFFLLCVSLFAMLSCAKARQGATENGFIVTGIPRSTEVTVTPPLALYKTGTLYGRIASDVSPAPSTKVTYAIFAEEDNKTILSHAHILMATLPDNIWEFVKESWNSANSLAFDKTEEGSLYFTHQTLIVNHKEDWFSDFWQKNSYSSPEYWLARRISFTPLDNTRIVAEYREPLPSCLLPIANRLSSSKSLRLSATDRQEIWGQCSADIQRFTETAEHMFTFEKASMSGLVPSPKPLEQPRRNIDATRYIGEARYVDRKPY